jgi:hypothetical protein
VCQEEGSGSTHQGLYCKQDTTVELGDEWKQLRASLHLEIHLFVCQGERSNVRRYGERATERESTFASWGLHGLASLSSSTRINSLWPAPVIPTNHSGQKMHKIYEMITLIIGIQHIVHELAIVF